MTLARITVLVDVDTHLAYDENNLRTPTRARELVREQIEQRFMFWLGASDIEPVVQKVELVKEVTK
jgi:hypothetical protein